MLKLAVVSINIPVVAVVVVVEWLQTSLHNSWSHTQILAPAHLDSSLWQGTIPGVGAHPLTTPAMGKVRE